MRRLLLAGFTVLALGLSLVGCGHVEHKAAELTRHTGMELMDWHIAGLWVINSPVVWVRVTNYNAEPIKEITFQYNTYDVNGKPLNEGTYTIEGTVQPHQTKNFIELYVGLVDLYSEHLSLRLKSVEKG